MIADANMKKINIINVEGKWDKFIQNYLNDFRTSPEPV